VSGGPRRSPHGKFLGFALCSGLSGSDSNALTPAFQLPGEASHHMRGKFRKGQSRQAEIPAPLKPAGIFAVGFSAVRISRPGFILQKPLETAALLNRHSTPEAARLCVLLLRHSAQKSNSSKYIKCHKCHWSGL